MLDARIASALNKIIQNSYFKKKVSLDEQKSQNEDRFLRGRQIAYMIYDYFQVTGAHHTVLDDADLFTVTLRNDNVQEFERRWDEILLSMTKIPSGNVLKFCTNREYMSPTNSKPCWNCMTWNFIRRYRSPISKILKTMVN